MFYVGQKVVCVDDSPSKFTGAPTTVRKGEVYTVSWFGSLKLNRHPLVTLAEVEPPVDHNVFDGERFRPVAVRKTDISIFKAMLNPKTAEIDA